MEDSKKSLWASLITELEDDCESSPPASTDEINVDKSRDIVMPRSAMHNFTPHNNMNGADRSAPPLSSLGLGRTTMPSSSVMTSKPLPLISIGSSASSPNNNMYNGGRYQQQFQNRGGGGGFHDHSNSDDTVQFQGFNASLPPFQIGGLGSGRVPHFQIGGTGTGIGRRSIESPPFPTTNGSPLPFPSVVGLRPLPPSPTETSLPNSISLSRWIDHHKAATNRHVNNGPSWRRVSSTQNNSTPKQIDEDYIKKAVQIALSLTIKVRENGQHPQKLNITLHNVMVLDTNTGSCDFVNTNQSIWWGGAGEGRDSSRGRKESSLIYSLGKLFYNIFTQGLMLPESFKQGEEEEGVTADSEDGDKGFQSRLGGLNLTTLNGSSSALGDNSTAMDEEEDEENSQEKLPKQRPRRDDNADAGTVELTSTLERHKVPHSIIRLLTDMLANVPTGVGGLPTPPESAITALSDVECDLRQMSNVPHRFLFDSVMIWKPVIQDKFYCRENEMKKALDTAGRVKSCGLDRLDELLQCDDMVGCVNQEVLMLSGDAGSGKSHFARELSTILEEKKGWRCIHCKCDRVMTRPLSFIILAFDRFFSRLLNDSASSSSLFENRNTITDDDYDSDTHDELQEIRKRILVTFGGNENTATICHLIPSLRRVISSADSRDEFSNTYHEGHEIDLGGSLQSDTDASKCRLHHLLGLLLKSISHTKPLLLFVDDLHFSDQSSLDLIVALIHQQVNEQSNVLFMGSYRTDEVSDRLDASLRQIHSLNNVTLSEISVDGLSSDDVNVMVSEALAWPQRLTRSLSKLIQKKSMGNPLCVKELLNDLSAENLLNYSLVAKKWVWDEKVIASRSISDGVAELLTRRLLRLPHSRMLSLQIVSIFGSEVPVQVLEYIRKDSVCGMSDITAELDLLVSEGLITLDNSRYRFVHDMIEHSVQMGIKPDEKQIMLKEISEKLFVCTVDSREDSILFILAGLVNDIGVGGAASIIDSLRYANLNLTAGEKAIKAASYHSASKYLECGISFLGTNCWNDSYDLSLGLYSHSVIVQHALGETELMMMRVNTVLEKARSYYDKLDTMYILIQFYSLGAHSLSKSLEQSFLVLEQLGETFPTVLEPSIIGKELLEVKTLLNQYTPKSICEIQPMNNKYKIKAMNFLMGSVITCYQLKSPHHAMLCCRMVRLTLEWGMHENSGFGIGNFAMSFSTAFRDIAEGYMIGKYVQACTTRLTMPQCYWILYGGIKIWKEPMQAILPELLKAYTAGMNESGSITNALSISMLYVYRAFFSGSKLLRLSKETASFMHMYSLYQRQTMRIANTPISNAMAALVGLDDPRMKKYIRGNEDCDQILTKSLAVNEITVAETVIVCKLMVSFIFRDMTKAEKIARKHLPFLDTQQGGPLQFINIYKYFYGGLIAFHLIRSNEHEDPYWLDFGLRAIEKFKAWTSECEWNFQNSYLLLQAEHHFATNDVENAKSMYKLAISSSKDHRFIHEEALSCECASIFYNSLDEEEISKRLVKRAIECYESWGAQEKANALRNSSPLSSTRGPSPPITACSWEDESPRQPASQGRIRRRSDLAAAAILPLGGIPPRQVSGGVVQHIDRQD